MLVIDEFPYLVKTNAAFPSILQNAWDEILKDSNVMLILCGSLISMMQNTPFLTIVRSMAGAARRSA